jgi:gamma-glutamylcyclotransferase (GGCT)/AIG2-like uncharacterized protein YtfP
MSKFLFSYGTLLPQHAPKEMAAAVEKLRPAGDGVIYGDLYDLGEYPGAVLDPSSQSKPIYGKVFRLPDDENLLPEIDMYEGFDPSDSSGSLFVRELHPVPLTSGEVLQCWVYVYNRDPGTAPMIASGRYGER